MERSWIPALYIGTETLTRVSYKKRPACEHGPSSGKLMQMGSIKCELDNSPTFYQEMTVYKEHGTNVDSYLRKLFHNFMLTI